MFLLCLGFLSSPASPLNRIFNSTTNTSTVFAAPGINKQINFQGKLVNANGTNVTNGSYSIVFSIYTVSSGGAAIWTETQTPTVTDGIFQVQLGSVTSLPGSVDFNTDNIYLGIKVGADAEMTPRIRFASVPQAFNAERLGGLTSSGFIQNGTGQQATSNFNISGNGTAGTSFTTPLLQSAAATALNITGNAASTWSTTAGNITIQAGSGTVSLGTSSNLTAGGALAVRATSGNLTLGTTTSGNVVIDGAGTLDVQDNATFAGATTINGVTTHNTDTDFTFAGTENLVVTSDLAGTVDLISVTGTPSVSAGITRGIVLQQADSANANGLDTALLINNADTNLAVATGIQFTSSGGGFTNYFDTPTIDITGVGAINGATGITSSGTITFSGASVTIGASALQGSLILNDGNGGQTATIQAGNIAANTVLTLPSTLGAADTFCFVTLANCSGSATTLQATYGADVDGSDVIISLTATDDSLIFRNPAASGTDSTFLATFEQLNTGAKDLLVLTQAGTGYALRVNDDGTSTDSTPFVIDQNGNVGIGTAAPASPFGGKALQVLNTAGNSSIIAEASSGSSAIFNMNITGATADWHFENQNGNFTITESGTATRITALQGGNVGIGDGSPMALFTVGTNDAFQVDASGNTTTTGTFGANGAGVLGGGHATLGVMIGGGTNGSEIKLRNSGTSHYSIANTANVLTIGRADSNANIGSAITPVLTFSGAGTATFAQPVIIQGASATVGTITQAGSIALHDGSGQTATINLGNITANSILTLPATLGATDTFCFQTMANCSGGVASSGIAGALQFSGGSGAFSSDASNFFWNNTTKRLGVGTAAPNQVLHISSATSTAIQINTTGLTPLALNGIKSGTVFSNDAGIGTIAWSNASNASVSDDQRAVAAAGTSNYLKATGFNFNIPAGATVTGIEANIERRASTSTQTYNYSGAQQTYIVPAGVTSVTIESWGAEGGNAFNSGGLGGYAKGNVAVTPGETLYVNVGGAGSLASGGSCGTTAYSGGGWNGGGNGASNQRAGGGGGGASDVRKLGTALANRIIVAGGGGGGGNGVDSSGYSGGTGGGTSGGSGASGGGTGGSQTAGGTTGGAPGTGGIGGTDGCNRGGGGGGGGYYGGGGGAGGPTSYGGGGGAGYTGGVTNATMSNGTRSGNGLVTISYGTTVSDNRVSLVNASGTVLATNKAAGGTWSSTDTTITYGGAGDTWSSSLTAADVNNANFGIVFSATSGAAAQAEVDYISLRVYYTTSSESNWVLGTDHTSNGNFTLTGSSQLSGSQHFVMKTTGELGLGVADPLARFHVNGDVLFKNTANSANALRVENSSGTAILTVDTENGKVGIGTSSPGATLTVAGGNNINAQYPDGLVGSSLTSSVTSASTYTVPVGKTLYITNALTTDTNTMLRVNGISLYRATQNYSTQMVKVLSQPIIAEAGSVISSSSANAIVINGKLINSNVTPATQSVTTTSTYTVPAGKTLYITNAYTSDNNTLLRVDNLNVYKPYQAQDTNQINTLAQPIVADAGSVISSSTANTIGFNGYLTKSTGLGGADLAERYFANGSLEPGDVVMVDASSRTDKPTVTKSGIAYDARVLGIVTTQPNQVYEDDLTRNSNEPQADVALAGRVPVKISGENGSIKVGDPLAPSSIPGVAMKATKAGRIIGTAMEASDCSDISCQGKVLAFVQLDSFTPKQSTHSLKDVIQYGFMLIVVTYLVSQKAKPLKRKIKLKH